MAIDSADSGCGSWTSGSRAEFEAEHATQTNEGGEREEEGEKEHREREREGEGRWLSLFRFQQYQQGALSCVLRAEHVNHH